MTLDQLGNAQPDTRNPVLVTVMETLGETENRYSGIPTIRFAMKNRNLPEPVFADRRSEFVVTLYNGEHGAAGSVGDEDVKEANVQDEKGLLKFCRTPRSRSEIIAYLNIASGQYALRRYLDPLVECGAIRMTLPNKPRSSKQRYVAAGEEGHG